VNGEEQKAFSFNFRKNLFFNKISRKTPFSPPKIISLLLCTYIIGSLFSCMGNPISFPKKQATREKTAPPPQNEKMSESTANHVQGVL
jgi:hypothetical protein